MSDPLSGRDKLFVEAIREIDATISGNEKQPLVTARAKTLKVVREAMAKGLPEFEATLPPPACGACKFAALYHAGSVECRRMPPHPAFEVTGGVSNVRPRVGAYFWCGEFQRGPGPDVNAFYQHQGTKPPRKKAVKGKK